MTKDCWATFVSTLPEEDDANPHPKGWPVILRRFLTTLELCR